MVNHGSFKRQVSQVTVNIWEHLHRQLVQLGHDLSDTKEACVAGRFSICHHLHEPTHDLLKETAFWTIDVTTTSIFSQQGVCFSIFLHQLDRCCGRSWLSNSHVPTACMGYGQPIPLL